MYGCVGGAYKFMSIEDSFPFKLSNSVTMRHSAVSTLWCALCECAGDVPGDIGAWPSE